MNAINFSKDIGNFTPKQPESGKLHPEKIQVCYCLGYGAQMVGSQNVGVALRIIPGLVSG